MHQICTTAPETTVNFAHKYASAMSNTKISFDYDIRQEATYAVHIVT